MRRQTDRRSARMLAVIPRAAGAEGRWTPPWWAPATVWVSLALWLSLALCVTVAALAGLTGCSAADDGAAGGGAAAPPPAAPTPSGTPSTPAPTPSPKSTSTVAAGTATAGKTVTKIVFVDVGQGDAILITSGKTDVLVDGGPEGSDAAVAAAMRKAGMDDLDVVVATHMHADHVGATDELIERYRPRRLLLAGACSPTLKDALRGAGGKLEQARRGDTYRWGALRVKVLSPATIGGEANEDSLVLLLEVAGRRILLTGDLTGPNEAAVGTICARGPPLFILKVAHHGSRYSTGTGFLEDTRPRFAVITVGPNSYGHPTPDTVGRLRASGARVYTTQKNGTITVTILPSGVGRWRFGRSSKPL